MRVLAVILNYKSAELSCHCADLLKLQTSECLDIAIVDNDSEVEIEELQSYCRSNDLLFLRSGANRGYSAGNNIGLRYALDHGYDYALIVNPDVEIRDRYYVDVCCSKLDQLPDVAVLATDIEDSKGRHQNPMREPTYLEELCWPVESVKARLKRRPLYHLDYSKSGYCPKVSGCCFFVRLSFTREYGLLDESVFLYCEEPILAARVSAAGQREYYLHTVTAFHLHQGGGDLHKGNMAMLEESREYYHREYCGYTGVKLQLLLASRRLHIAILALWGRIR